MRTCGDFRLTLNTSIQADWYPLPSTEDLFAFLAEGKLFSKVNFSDAYLQIELDEESKQCIVINTHNIKVFSNITDYLFGVSFAVGLFQNTIERVIQGLPGVFAYLDDV